MYDDEVMILDEKVNYIDTAENLWKVIAMTIEEILSKEENKGKIAFFGGIKNCRFKGQVTPGDVLEMECVLTKQKGPVGIGEAIAKVNGKVVCKAELTFAIQ